MCARMYLVSYLQILVMTHEFHLIKFHGRNHLLYSTYVLGKL
jgi:hypothetical protein